MTEESKLTFITNAFGYLIYRNGDGFLEMWKRYGERELASQEVDNAKRDLTRIVTNCTEVSQLTKPVKKKAPKYNDDNQLKIE